MEKIFKHFFNVLSCAILCMALHSCAKMENEWGDNAKFTICGAVYDCEDCRPLTDMTVSLVNTSSDTEPAGYTRCKTNDKGEYILICVNSRPGDRLTILVNDPSEQYSCEGLSIYRNGDMTNVLTNQDIFMTRIR